MVYDSAIQKLVMFGGNSSAPTAPDVLLDDTWTLDASGTWTLCTCTSHPSRRSSPGMAWDQTLGRNNVVLFGGYGSITDCGTTHKCGDTWTFDGSQWTQCIAPNCTVNPSPRSSPGMAWQGSPQNQVVLYGGVTGATDAVNGETWFWTGTNWSQCSTCTPSNSPSARSGHRMDYDAIQNEVVLFGGFDKNNTTNNETWFWNGTAWCGPTNGCTQATSPAARCCGGLAYFGSPVRKMVLFGGSDADPGQIRYGDTWTWNQAGGWVCVSPFPCS